MIWIEYILVFAATFGISFFISLKLPASFAKRGLYDKKSLPEKKITAGGVAIVIPFILIVGSVHLVYPDAFGLDNKILYGLLTALLLIGLLGFYDDTKGANALTKLSVQTVAAIILIGSGLEMGDITNPLASPVDTGLWGNIILIVWILALTNAVNLIDGIDGLASGICLISTVTLFVISHLFGEQALSLLALALAGSIAGFIKFNLPPAKLFLGDTGSLFLGFALAAISLTERRKGSVTLTLLIPFVVLAVPVIDTALAFFRRVIKGKNPFSGDQLHIHHRLLNLGLSDSQVNLMLYLFSIFLGVTAGVLAFFPKETSMVVLLLIGVGFLLGFEFLRSLEKGDKG